MLLTHVALPIGVTVLLLLWVAVSERSFRARQARIRAEFFPELYDRERRRR